jgi:hypothetical protein
MSPQQVANQIVNAGHELAPFLHSFQWRMKAELILAAASSH